tara:strand:+ start:177 stop:509 length:333 start_codon:yes stop_codon:yes gene_type:complete
MNKNLVSEGKYLIGLHDIDSFKDLYYETKKLSNRPEYKINYEYLFVQLLNHACLKRDKQIIIFLMRIYYEIFDDVSQIALRQSFVYPKYIIKDKTLTKWYSKNILPLVKT